MPPEGVIEAGRTCLRIRQPDGGGERGVTDGEDGCGVHQGIIRQAGARMAPGAAPGQLPLRRRLTLVQRSDRAQIPHRTPLAQTGRVMLAQFLPPVAQALRRGHVRPRRRMPEMAGCLAKGQRADADRLVVLEAAHAARHQSPAVAQAFDLEAQRLRPGRRAQKHDLHRHRLLQGRGPGRRKQRLAHVTGPPASHVLAIGWRNEAVVGNLLDMQRTDPVGHQIFVTTHHYTSQFIPKTPMNNSRLSRTNVSGRQRPLPRNRRHPAF